MAEFALVDATTYIHGFDFTGKTNQISVTVEAEDLDSTVFGGNGYRSRKAGLRNVEGEHSGFWDDEVDAEVFSDLGVADRPVTVSPTGAELSPAYLYQAGKFSYEQFGGVGELTPFSVSMMGTNSVGLVRGRLCVPRQTVNATGALGGIAELGAVTTGKFLYAAVHVFDPATTITLAVRSSATDDMGSPTTRGTVGPITAAGGTWMTRVAAPITDTFWQVSVTAITGTFDVAVAVGIA